MVERQWSFGASRAPPNSRSLMVQGLAYRAIQPIALISQTSCSENAPGRNPLGEALRSNHSNRRYTRSSWIDASRQRDDGVAYCCPRAAACIKALSYWHVGDVPSGLDTANLNAFREALLELGYVEVKKLRHRLSISRWLR
jgi:hypothetical protein